MKRNLLILVTAGLLTLGGCSDHDKDDATQAPASTAPQTGTASQPATQPQANAAPRQYPSQGKVLQAMHAAGYTYMEIAGEDGQAPFWVAATMLNVKRDDKVQWSNAALMKNFNSNTLRRTFDDILFVSQASVVP